MSDNDKLFPGLTEQEVYEVMRPHRWKPFEDVELEAILRALLDMTGVSVGDMKIEFDKTIVLPLIEEVHAELESSRRNES